MISLNVKDRCHNCPDFIPEIHRDIRYGKDPDPVVDTQIICQVRGLCDRNLQYLQNEEMKQKAVGQRK